MTSAPRLVLGSASPRRLALLQQLGVQPDIVTGADIDETPRKGETPKAYVLRMALEKNAALVAQFPNDFILTGDTTVVVGRRIIGKAEDEAEQRKFMQLFSGRSHRVMTAVACRAPDGRVSSRVQISRVQMRRMSDAEIETYVRSGEWKGKAGYMFGGRIDHTVKAIQGSPSGIIGLPLYETMQLLNGLGYHGYQA